MRFVIRTAELFETPKDILDAYPVLKEYEPRIDFPYKNKDRSRLTVEITDLIKFREDIGQDIVLTEDWMNDNTLKIIIYDGYIE